MRKLLLALTATFTAAAIAPPSAQSQGLDLSNTQVHGYATQGFIYTTQDNWNSTDSSDGSAAWTEAVVNLTSEPEPRLRIGVQARYYILGNYGNEITLDYAQADYKVNERFGFRVGKVKTPVALFNEIQDVDPAYLWAILPQSIYPIASRNSFLAHYGGVVYGALPLGDMGKLEYRAFGGERVLAPDDGAFSTFERVYSFSPTQSVSVPVGGAALRWTAPFPGLLLSVSGYAGHIAGGAAVGPYPISFDSGWVTVPIFSARYERAKWMVAGEYSRFPPNFQVATPIAPTFAIGIDQRAFYGMATYKAAPKLTAGLYYSSSNDHQAVFDSNRYQKDWALAARYDFNPSLYLKAEQHIIDGTQIGLAQTDAATGLKPNTRLTLLKLGVSF